MYAYIAIVSLIYDIAHCPAGALNSSASWTDPCRTRRKREAYHIDTSRDQARSSHGQGQYNELSAMGLFPTH